MSRRRTIDVASRAGLALLLLACAVVAPAARAAEIAAGHPLVGTWEFPIPRLDCTETYTFRRDGTALVRSATEISEMSYTISAQPSARGFFRWEHTIVKSNGRQDCGGAVMEVGSSVTQYVFFHGSPDVFFLCAEETTRNCIGPFLRQKGQGV